MFYIGPATFQVFSSCGYYGDHCHCSCGDRSQILLIREVGGACGKVRRLGIDREKGSIKLLGVNPPNSSSRFLTGIAVEMGPVEKFVLVSP